MLAERFRDNPRLATFGRTAAVGIEVTEPLSDIATGVAERLVVFIFHDGRLFGTTALPAFEGCVRATSAATPPTCPGWPT